MTLHDSGRLQSRSLLPEGTIVLCYARKLGGSHADRGTIVPSGRSDLLSTRPTVFGKERHVARKDPTKQIVNWCARLAACLALSGVVDVGLADDRHGGKTVALCRPRARQLSIRPCPRRPRNSWARGARREPGSHQLPQGPGAGLGAESANRLRQRTNQRGLRAVAGRQGPMAAFDPSRDQLPKP